MKELLSTYKAFERLNRHYVQFLKEPQKRQHILESIEVMTDIVCADKKVSGYVKHRTRNKLEQFRRML